MAPSPSYKSGSSNEIRPASTKPCWLICARNPGLQKFALDLRMPRIVFFSAMVDGRHNLARPVEYTYEKEDLRIPSRSRGLHSHTFVN
jgi:hypothetical protein